MSEMTPIPEIDRAGELSKRMLYTAARLELGLQSDGGHVAELLREAAREVLSLIALARVQKLDREEGSLGSGPTSSSTDLGQPEGREATADAASPWRGMDSAPKDGTRVLVHFQGAGPIVAFAHSDDEWVRYLGFGKSGYVRPIHADYATRWMPLPTPPMEGEG